MKKILKLAFVGAIGALFMLAGCTKDFSGDIQNLDKRVSALEETVKQLQSDIESGKVIKDITKIDNGIRITLADGTSYDITNGKDGANGKDGVDGKDGKDGANGKDGVNGKDGKDGKDGETGPQGPAGPAGPAGPQGSDGTSSICTIGENGNWWINGEDTGFPARGEDGADAPVWTPGEDGFWYKDGVKTDQKWAVNGVVTAVVTDKVLFISVDGTEIAAINLSAQLAGLILNYDYVRGVNNVKRFVYNINQINANVMVYDYLFQANGKDAKGEYAVPTYIGSNETSFTYKLNPSNADVDAYKWNFNAIDVNYHSVGTKVLAGGDPKDGGCEKFTDWMKVSKAVKYAKDPSNVTVTAMLFPHAIPVDSDFGTDYVAYSAYGYYPMRTELEATSKTSGAIVRSEDEQFMWETLVKNYNVIPAITKCQNPASAAAVKMYPAEYVTIDETIAYTPEFNYQKSLDLNTVVDLYSNNIDFALYKGLVRNLGRDIKFHFELAGINNSKVVYGNDAIYLGKDGVTDQNEYVEINADGVISVKDYKESSINREPLVHVIAYTMFDGAEYRFCDGYLRVKVTNEEPAPELPEYQKMTDRYAHFAADDLTQQFTSMGTVAPVSELKVTFAEFSKEVLDVLGLSYEKFLATYDTENIYVLKLDNAGEKVQNATVYATGTDTGYLGSQAVISVPTEPKTSTTIGELQINEEIAEAVAPYKKVYGKEQKVILGFKHATSDTYIGMEFRFLVDEPTPAPAHKFVIDNFILNPNYLIDQDVNRLYFGTVANPTKTFDPAKNKGVAGVRVKGIDNLLTSSLLEHFKEYKIGTLEKDAYLEFTILNFKEDSYKFTESSKGSAAGYNITTVKLDNQGNETTTGSWTVSKIKITKDQLDKIQAGTLLAPEIRFIGSTLNETQNVLVKVTEVCTSDKCSAPKTKSGVYYVQFGTQFIIRATTIELATLKTATNDLIAKHIVIEDKNHVELFAFDAVAQKFVPTEAAKAAPYFFTDATEVAIKGTPELKYYAKDTEASFGGNLWISETANASKVNWFNDGTDLLEDKYAYIKIEVAIDNKFIAAPEAAASTAASDNTSVKVKVLKTEN